MTPHEIAAEDAENDRLAALREAKLKKPKKRMQIFEMGESGQTVEFPMTPDEIAAEEAENDRLAARREAKLKRPKKRVVKFELADGDFKSRRSFINYLSEEYQIKNRTIFKLDRLTVVDLPFLKLEMNNFYAVRCS